MTTGGSGTSAPQAGGQPGRARGVSLGKVRGLSALSDERGIFHILACDQRGAIVRMMKASGAGEPAYEQVVRAKLDIVGALAPHVTGVLLDPEYGVGPAVAHRILGRAGLAAAVDETGYVERAGERTSALLEGWSPGKVKAIGANAVKLLIYFNPRHERAAEAQKSLVAGVARACRALDIPFMLEVLVYPTREEAGPQAFLAEREDLICESARLLGGDGVDLYKVEFPHHPDLGGSTADWIRACERLSEHCRSPWALLSAGVEIDTYAAQLEAACRGGASGFVAGRAIWKEAITLAGEARERFLTVEMPARVARLKEIAARYARPWFEAPVHAYSPGELASEGWYRAYGPEAFARDELRRS